MAENYQNLAAERTAECAERAAYFDKRLRFFSKTNWITVMVPSLLGVLAGSALYADSNLKWIAIGTLFAALLTAVHKGLDCDAHQFECRRLVQAYRGLEVRYRTLAQIETSTIIDDLLALDVELAELRQSQTATINPQWLKRHLD